ncbi:hypothetical protein [Luteimicrobium album]|uniref:hypothetical protein n=1 Tax=Luteimicrobium album TaxID=1054550 RepID=UPI0024E0798E|nr:hypothetical protein [Luteimicrobium album]
MATLIEPDEGMKISSEHLGHGHENVTARHYVPKTHESPDVRSVLDNSVGAVVNTASKRPQAEA